MKTASTFGVSFILRISRSGAGYMYARITVDGSRTELAVKQQLNKKDWNVAKGMAKSKDARLRQFNEFL